MGSGKSSSGSKDYYGHVAGIICQGQLDFFGGLLVNNDMVYPPAHVWDSRTYQQGYTVIFTDGNVWKASQKTATDPNAFPWVLYATPWTAGTHSPGALTLYTGNVWKATVTTTVAPPTAVPGKTPAVQDPVPVNGWVYVCTPHVWSSGSGSNFWDINSIVVWQGEIWTNPTTGTKGEPGVSSDWIVWKIDRASSPNPLKFTVPHMGDVYLYWGTPDQTLDTANEAILSSLGHPPYRNLCFLVLKNFLFGTSQVNPPNVVVLGGRLPVQSLITGAATNFDSDFNVNPWCVIAEKLTHPVLGLGLPLAMFNQTAWQAEADRCAANPQLFYISPMWISLSSARSMIADLLGYPDAFIFWSTVAALTAGHWPHGDPAPAFTTANTINRDIIIQEISTNSDGWDGTSSSTVVHFEDIQAGFKSRPALAQNLFNLSVTRRVKSQAVERPFIIRFSQAAAWATEMAKIYGDQSSKGTLSVRAEKADSIEPGSIFLLTDDALQTSEPQRCTQKVASVSSGIIKLSHETERGLAPLPYSPTAVNPTSDTSLFPAAIQNVQFIQIPSSLGTGANQLVCLAARTTALTSSMDIWYRQKDGSAWQDLGNQAGFAVAAKMLSPINTHNNSADYDFGIITQGDTIIPGNIGPNAWDLLVQYDTNPAHEGAPVLTTATEGTDYTYDPISGLLTIVVGGNIADGSYVHIEYSNSAYVALWTSTPQQDIDDLVSPLTADQVADNDLIAFFVKASNPSQFEICTVTGVGAYIGAGNYVMGLKRAQYGTLLGGDGSYQWTYGDYCFIVHRANLLPLSHTDFPDLQSAGATATFRVSANSAWKQGDLDDLEDDASNPIGLTTEWTYTFSNRYAPKLMILSQQQNGADIANWSGTFATSDTIQLLLNLQDLNNDLAHITVALALADEQHIVYSQDLPPLASQNLLIQFSFPKIGRWRILVNALDRSGNNSQTVIPGDATSIAVSTSGTSGTPTLASYAIVGKKVTQLMFGIFPAATDTIKWQVKNRGIAPDAQGAGGGVWNTLTTHSVFGTGYIYGPIPAFDKGTKTLYAYRKSSSSANSATVQWNIDR